MFMLLSGKVQYSDVYSISDVKSMLKPNKTNFKQRNALADCKLFSEIMIWYEKEEDPIFTKGYHFINPYALINSFVYNANLEMTEDERVSLVHLYDKCFKILRKRKILKTINNC